MQFKANLLMPAIDFQDSKTIISAKIIEGNYRQLYEKLHDKLVSIEIKEWHAKRSLNANALFHVLCRKIAKEHNPPLSFDRCKNILIGRYGVPEMIDGIPATIKTNIPPEKILERDDMHCKLLKGGDENTFFYWIMKHTGDYNTAEFAKLLDGTIEDAKEMGIDIVTENEKQKALQLWGLQIQ